jgi:hypothetical protein
LKNRFKLALSLTPAVFMLAIWTIFLSSNPIVSTIEGAVKMIGWGVLMSFGVSLSVTGFLYDILQETKGKKVD